LFQLAQFELARLQHNHGGDEWHDMVDATPGHDSAESDPERQWARGRIFRCTACEDEIRISVPAPSAIEGARTSDDR
jgi:hypothetical protein